MFADENLRGENRKLSRTALGNEHDVQEGIGDAGFWCDWDTARDIASICNNHIVEIKLEAFSVVERDRRRVTAQFSKCCRGATQVSEWSPRSLHFGCEFFVHHAAESTGRNIHKIADAIASDADKVDGPDSQVVVVRFPPVKKGESVRLRISETYTAPQSYRLDGDELVFDRSLGRPRNSIVLPDGWYLTALSIPGVIRQTPDGSTRIDFVNGRNDSIDVLIKGKKTR